MEVAHEGLHVFRFIFLLAMQELVHRDRKECMIAPKIAFSGKAEQ